MVALCASLATFLAVVADGRVYWYEALALVGIYICYALICCFYTALLRRLAPTLTLTPTPTPTLPLAPTLTLTALLL